MKNLTSIIAVLLIGSAIGFALQQFKRVRTLDQEVTSPQAGIEANMEEIRAVMRAQKPSYEGSSISGSYLSGRFAQRHHDWKTAGRYIDYVLKDRPNNEALLKRAMVLAMGAGDYSRANDMARSVIEQDPHNSLSLLFLTAEAFKNKDYDGAADHVVAMPEGGLSSFIMPLLYSWSSAALGEYDTEGLKSNSVHLYHAILIAEFMGKTDAIRDMLTQALSVSDLDAEDAERIADIYAHIGETKNAVSLYKQALIIDSENTSLQKKIDLATSGEGADIFTRVKTPEQGVAEAFYDMARLLAQDYSDESARVFARIAIYLSPELTSARLLLAQIASRNERYDEAVALYESVDKDDKDFLRARRNAADILHELKRSEEAISAFEMLAHDYDDIESFIRIGDIYRLDGQYKEAIKTYNEVAKNLGPITKEHWHLHYVRGMSYEQNGQWNKAEKDLQAALEFQPDHPYVLNYLGYAWADQGENLEIALEMIETAVELRPGDGYITDSLGWVYYRMGRYNDAVPYLEQAVELMPYDPTINDHLGDAYWIVGRRLEAEFQWKRAKNHADDAALILAIEQKLEDGLEEPESVKEVRSFAPEKASTQRDEAQATEIQ